MDKIKTGQVLQKAREFLGLSINGVAEILKVKSETIEQIERGNFDETSILIPQLELIYGINLKEEIAILSATNDISLNQLTEKDKQAVLNLVRFVKIYTQESEDRNENK